MPQDRLDALIRTLLAVAGGALAASLVLFLNSDSLELDAALVGALQLSWVSLFYVLAACGGIEFLALFGPPAGVRRPLKRVLVGTAFAAFLVGLALLAYVSLVALAGANSGDDDTPQETRSAISFLVVLPRWRRCGARCASRSWKRRSRCSPRAARRS